MKQPKPRGSVVDMQRMASWARDFSGYRITVTEARIDRWIKQFRKADRDLAARVLDCVEFVTHEQMTTAMRAMLNGIPGWNRDEQQREGRWRFVAYSGSAGESGDTMLHKFRLANNLTQRRYNELFIHRSELLKEDFGPEDTIVFIDDFSGTGDQVCNAWPLIEELLPGDPSIYLILVAATVSARDRIARETGLTLVPYNLLNNADNVFASECRHFTVEEKEALLKYCRIGDRQNPKGRGECGLLIVFAHNCPNNTVAVLHANNQRWEGLFRRHD